MRKFFAFLIAICLCVASYMAMAANVQVKKASSVKKQEKSGIESVTTGSLLPGVIGLVSGVSNLTKQQQALEEECVPTSTEIAWVNKMVKEYAKTGAKMTVASRTCQTEQQYQEDVLMNKPTDNEICDYVFGGTEDNDKIWYGYPKVGVAQYCMDGDVTGKCPSSKKKKISNIYDIFGKIVFEQGDYKTDEANMYVKMMEKTEKCAPGKISARTKEAYSQFLTGTISNMGQTTNTGSIMNAVQGVSGGGLSGVGSLAPTVLQFLDK